MGMLAILAVGLATTARDGRGSDRTGTSTTIAPRLDAAHIGSSSSAPDTTPAPTTTTPIVIEHVALPPGTREYATARPDRATIRVRRTPPARWGASLSPVVTPSDPEPPRSNEDLTREPLPSESVPITGRTVTDQGWEFDNPGTYEPPQPLVFGVVQRQGRWLEVQVPVRPNGTTGWVHDSALEVASTTLAIHISLTERRLQLIDRGVLLLDVPAGIGRSATPTPTGQFTVTDVVPSANAAGGYGPVALALDGYSESLDRFGSDDGSGGAVAGVPVLAIHGTNRPASVGQAESNGCPRLTNDDIVRLAALAPAGTPVQIWP